MEQSTIQGFTYLAVFLVLLGAFGLALCKAFDNSESKKDNEEAYEQYLHLCESLNETPLTFEQYKADVNSGAINI